MTRFTEDHYRKLYQFIVYRYGLQYGHEKKDILFGRAEKVMKRNGIDSHDVFVEAIVSDRYPDLAQAFINSITVNKTDFFRESQHFDYILQHADTILKQNPTLLQTGELRAWSAASSTGEEPYTLAMVLREAFGNDLSIKVLGTDIDTSVLQKAQQGLYQLSSLKDIPRAFLLKYFQKSGHEWQIKREIREMVTFRSFNLMNPFPFRYGFDMVFCRNVMIYFSRETQSELIQKIYHSLNRGGLLFTGHSEALPNKGLSFKYIGPAIYAKANGA